MDLEPNINSTTPNPPADTGIAAPSSAKSGNPAFAQKTLTPAAAQPPASSTGGPGQGIKGFYRENRLYVWAVVTGILLIAILSFFAFRKAPVVAPKDANLAITADVPQTVPAGSQAVYKITISNNDTQKLVGLSLEVAYPDGVTFVSSSPNPQNLSGTVFAVPDLVPGQNATVFLKAQVSGNVNDQKDLGLKIHYHFSNSSSEFIKQQTVSVRLTASDVTLDLSGQASITNAQQLTYTLKFQNNSSNTIGNARIQFHYPDGFAFATAQPQPDSGSNVWNLSPMTPGSSGTITVTGSFASANPGESKTFSADLLILGQDGQYYTQNNATFTATLANLPLLVSQNVDNVNTSGTVNPGDTLNVSIKYQNNSSVVATGVNILVTLNSKALDLSSIQAEGAQVTGNTILWNGASVANLQSLNPSDSGQLTFSVDVKNPATKDSSKNLTVVSDIKIKSNEYDSYFPGNQVNLKVASPVFLRSALTYQSGSQPPQVGKATLYAVTLQLTNSTNDFTGGTLTAFIPLGAGGFVPGSVNVIEAGNVEFDPSTGKLTWQVGPLAAHTGQFTSARTLQFGIRLVPSASQQGSEPTLVKSIQFSAVDSFTGQSVSASANNLTTNDLPNNQDGRVQ